MIIKVSHPSILFTALMLYPILIASLCHLVARTTLAGHTTWKFVNDLSPGNEPPTLSALFGCTWKMVTIAVISRAPPVYIFPETTLISLSRSI